MFPMPHLPAARFLPRTARYGWLALMAVVIAAGASGCAGLPKDVQRPVSTAFTAPETTALVKRAAIFKPLAAR